VAHQGAQASHDEQFADIEAASETAGMTTTAP
jgi:hypothetical protein